jgi:hypothetical protein
MKFFDEINNVSFEILDDFMDNAILADGSYRPARVMFPQIKSINHNSGYVVMKDDTIRCSLGCSASIAQYDGCKEVEILQMWGN